LIPEPDKTEMSGSRESEGDWYFGS